MNGEIDEWHLHERANVDSIFDLIARGFPRAVVGFGIVSQEGDLPADYGRVFIRLAEVASVEIHGMLDETALLGPWAEGQSRDDLDRPEDEGR